LCFSYTLFDCPRLHFVRSIGEKSGLGVDGPYLYPSDPIYIYWNFTPEERYAEQGEEVFIAPPRYALRIDWITPKGTFYGGNIISNVQPSDAGLYNSIHTFRLNHYEFPYLTNNYPYIPLDIVAYNARPPIFVNVQPHEFYDTLANPVKIKIEVEKV